MTGSPCDPHSPHPARSLGHPRIHLRLVDSTNTYARRLAEAGAVDGSTVTAAHQSAGRGRQGRSWVAPPGRALLASVVVRDPPRLLPLATGLAVAESSEALTGRTCLLKWPNDVLLDGRKVAGTLVEGRPQEGWAVVGIGLNVALGADDFPPEIRDTAGTLGLEPREVEPALAHLLERLGRWVAAGPQEILQAVRARDGLRGHHVRWGGGEGKAADVDEQGRLVVATAGGMVALESGEVHLVGP